MSAITPTKSLDQKKVFDSTPSDPNLPPSSTGLKQCPGIKQLIDFYKWFKEYDKRRDVSFLETFPEMENFWNLCKNLAGDDIRIKQV